MRPLSLARRMAAPAAALIGLWLHGGAWAMASMAPKDSTHVTVASDALRSTPDLAEPCHPCMTCPVAPAAIANSCNQPDGQQGTDRWPEAGWHIDHDAFWNRAADGPSALPLRIAFCRWLN